MAGQLIRYNNDCIIPMQRFVWVIFFKKATKAFCCPAHLTVDGWFQFFSSKRLGKSQFTPILLTEARICLYNLRMYGHAPLLMGIYNITRSDEDYMLTNVLLSQLYLGKRLKK